MGLCLNKPPSKVQIAKCQTIYLRVLNLPLCSLQADSSSCCCLKFNRFTSEHWVTTAGPIYCLLQVSNTDILLLLFLISKPAQLQLGCFNYWIHFVIKYTELLFTRDFIAMEINLTFKYCQGNCYLELSVTMLITFIFFIFQQ